MLPGPTPSAEEVRRDLEGLGIPCGSAPALEPIPGDAGARRYLRVRLGLRSLVLMLVPPEGDSERGGAAAAFPGELPYLNVQRYLKRLGLPVPEVYGWLPGTRRLYQEDFGEDSLAARADDLQLHLCAADLIRRMQELAVPDPSCVAFLRRFDAGAIRAELAEFQEFGLPPGARGGLLDAGMDALSAEVAALPAVFAHRDFHGDNLLVRPDGSLGLIDFQDAFLGPRLYDLASLLTDRESLLVRRGADALAPFLRPGEEREFWLCALQRQLKVAGRFEHLERKGKAGYRRYLPSTWRMIAAALKGAGRPELRELLASLGCPL